jgi:hypothetical protein
MDDAIALTIAELMIYTPERYSTEIFAAARQYWKDGSRGGFTTRMNGTIKFGLTAAFEQGASVSGVEPDEFEAPDTKLMTDIITDEKSHVGELLTFLDGLANDKSKTLASADYRLHMWANRYQAVLDQARIHFGGKKRLTWVLGSAEHCQTCLDLSKIVAWAQEWDASGIRPKSPDLACHGYNCACEMAETTRRRSPKALERIMNAIGAA